MALVLILVKYEFKNSSYYNFLQSNYTILLDTNQQNLFLFFFEMNDSTTVTK